MTNVPGLQQALGASLEMTQQLAASLGLPLFSTDLFMPDYAPGASGRWRLVSGGFVIDHGYHSGSCATAGTPLLMRRRDGDDATWDTWMSLSPHEIESQELGCRHAFGHTVVMGLGMGWAALNIALNPQVRRVTVIERDPEVIDLFASSGALHGVPAAVAGKMRVVEADALAWQPDEPVDFIHADIWRTLAEESTLDDVRRMQRHIGAACIYVWGQELLIHEAACRMTPDSADPRSWSAAVRQAMEQTGLPLLSPPGMDYPAFVARVAALRRARWPAGIPDMGFRRGAES